MLNDNIKNLILETINLYENSNLNQAIIDEGFQKLKQAKELLSADNDKPVEAFDEEEIPFICINYYSPRMEDTQDIIIPFYATDFYQKEYLQDDCSETFKLRYELDGKVSYKNIKAGDNEVNFGKLEKGIHWYSLQLEDKYGRVSRRIFNEIWIVNKEEYEIKESETYIITDDDLIKYNINKANSEVVEDMVNTRVGLTNLFNDLQKQGFRKCVLPNGIYRINKGDSINIPTKFTVDMNGSTFKLHPYNDADYGTTGSIYNTMVIMDNTFDSHVINGIFEGDYAERQVNGWLRSYNGEHSGGFISKGGEYNSLDNITITQIAGYNSSVQLSNPSPFSGLGAWEDNIVVKNGVDTVKEGYVTSKLSIIEEPLLSSHYIVASVWLGYGGLRGQRWNIDFHFYDENQNFIETIRTYQFTRCRIPENAKYYRVTFFGSSSDMGGISIHHMKSERNFVFNNCHWVDNRTCSNPNQFQHLTYLNCDFTRSGQSITPCEIDLEDGWEQMQDFFLEGCEIKEYIGTKELIGCSGINLQMEDCKNFNFTAKYNIRGITMRNNKNCGLNLTVGYKTGNTMRCYNNIIPNLSCQDTGEYFEKDKMTYLVKNNVLNGLPYSNKAGIIKDCIAYGLGGNDINIVDSTLYRTRDIDYIGKNIYAKNCIFKGTEGRDSIKFSFNAFNTKRIYEDCTFEAPTWFAGHYQFNSGIWNNCTFKDTLLINPNTEENNKALCMGAIQFNYCVFEKDLTIDTRYSEIQFNGCQFLGNIIYKDNAKSLVEFNDEMPTIATYIKIDNPSEFINLNETKRLTATVLPYTATNLNVAWMSSDPSIIEIDEEGNLHPKKEGSCTIIAKNVGNTIKDELNIKVVNIDYSVDQRCNWSGVNMNSRGYCIDNRFIEMNKTNITVVKPEDMISNITNIYVAQYDENKKYITELGQSCDYRFSQASFNLNSKTKYIRVSFKYSNTSNFAQLFATYRVE